MAKSLPVFNKLSSLQIFQLLRAGALFMSSVVIARQINDKVIIGQYETLLLLGSSFTYFWVSGIINTFVPYYNKHDQQQQKRLVFNVFLLLSGLSVVCFLILLGVTHFGLVNLPSAYYLPFLLFTLFNAPSFLIEYLFLVKNQAKSIVGYGAASSGMYWAAIAVPLITGSNLRYSLWALAFLGLAKFLVLLVLVIKRSSFIISFTELRKFAAKASPIILTFIVGGSMVYIDSYTIKYFFSDADFAIFQYGARELPFALLMANALSSVFSGDIAFAKESNEMEDVFIRLKNSSSKLMHLLFPMSILLLVFSTDIYRLVYGESFIRAAAIFNVYLLLIISRLLFPQAVMLGLQKNQMLFRISIVEWAVNLALNFLFIYLFGMIGVAYATIVAYFSEKFLQMIYLRKQGLKLFSYAPVRTWLIYSIILAVAFAIVQWL